MTPSSPDADRFSCATASVADLVEIQRLAEEIWFRAYPGIISGDQIRYMLDRMYDPAVMEEEQKNESVVYLKFLIDDAMRGFAAFGPAPQRGGFFLHKLYLHPDDHGRGIGQRMLDCVETEARRRDAPREFMMLRVNRNNTQAIRAYERAGFSITGEICSDIGGGYVMDDFWMRKEL